MELVLNCLNTIAIAILSILLFCLFLYNHHSKLAHAKEAPTVSGSWPILGHLHLFVGSQTLHRTLGALADKYIPLFTIKLGAKKALVLSNWEMAKECFTTNDIIVSSRHKLVAVEHLGYNQAMLGFAPYGPYWRELRKIATYGSSQIEKLSNCIMFVSPKFKIQLKNSSMFGYVWVDLGQWFSQLAFNTVLRMIVVKRYFGATNVDDEKAQRCIKAIKEFMHLLGVFTGQVQFLG